MKRKITALFLVGILAFGIAACSGSESGKGKADKLPAWSGEKLELVGKDASTKIKFPATKAPEKLEVQVDKAGDGKEVAADDFVIAHYVGQVWGNDKPFDSSFERGVPSGFSLNQVIAGWKDGLAGQKVGTHLMLSVPANLGYGPQGGNKNAGIGPEDVISFYIEIIDSYGRNQAGEANATKEADIAKLPVEITGELGAPIEVKVKSGIPEPTAQKATVIARGSGKPLGDKNTTAYIQYAMSFWDNSNGESTYVSTGPQPVQIGGGSVFDSLVGIPIGSRVLIEKPATSDTKSPTAGAYAVVVDIVGQMAGPAPQE